MEQIASIKSQLDASLAASEQGTGEYAYYEMKIRIFDTLIASILRDAAPNHEELEFYTLSYAINEIKKNGGSDAGMEARINELRPRFAKGPSTRLFS